MLHRNKKDSDVHRGKWNGLGGKIEPGETPEQCIIREVLEESGLTIRSPRMHGVLTFPDFKPGEDWYAFVFTASEFSGNLTNSPEGTLAWVDTDKVTDLNLWEGDHIFIKWLNQDRFFSGRFCYKNQQLTDHSVVFHG